MSPFEIAIIIIVLGGLGYHFWPRGEIVYLHLADKENPGLDWDKVKPGMKMKIEGKERKVLRVNRKARGLWYRADR
jgi:hypothetical protein